MGEDGHVEEGVKVALCRVIASGIVLIGASQVVDYLAT